MSLFGDVYDLEKQGTSFSQEYDRVQERFRALGRKLMRAIHRRKGFVTLATADCPSVTVNFHNPQDAEQFYQLLMDLNDVV